MSKKKIIEKIDAEIAALSNTQPPTSVPIREELEGLTEAREAYKSLFIANKIPPITFTVGVSTWKLNKNFNYDLIDQDTGEVLLKNVNKSPFRVYKIFLRIYFKIW